MPVFAELGFITRVFFTSERTRRFRWRNERVFSIISARAHSEATSPSWRCARMAKCRFIHNTELTYRFVCGNTRLLRHELFWHFSVLRVFHEVTLFTENTTALRIHWSHPVTFCNYRLLIKKALKFYLP